jgi:hypothetical protein
MEQSQWHVHDMNDIHNVREDCLSSKAQALSRTGHVCCKDVFVTRIFADTNCAILEQLSVTHYKRLIRQRCSAQHVACRMNRLDIFAV